MVTGTSQSVAGVKSYDRGAKPVSDGVLDKYGNPMDSNEAFLCGIVVTANDKLTAKPMAGGRGDVIEFQLKTNRRNDVQYRVTCFGELATVVGSMVRNGMRVSVEGRLRERMTGFTGRLQKQVDIVAWEVGVWDSDYKVHWLQYEPARFNDQGFVEPLAGDQGGVAVIPDGA